MLTYTNVGFTYDTSTYPMFKPFDVGFSDIIYVYFSKDRAMQLELALRSNTLFNWDMDYYQKEVVIYKYSSLFFEKGYNKLIEQYPHVTFIEEREFKTDLISALKGYKYVVFVVDDTVFVRKYSGNMLCQYIENMPDVLGVSLRLGKNTKYCYPLNRAQNVPKLQPSYENMYTYDWTVSDGDFGYPIELSSSIYPIEKIEYSLLNHDYSNPNELEWRLSRYAGLLVNKYKTLLIMDKSVAFSNPANKVQTVNQNRSGIDEEFSPLKLNGRFLNGEKIDINPLVDYIPNGCHEEVPYTFIGPESEYYYV